MATCFVTVNTPKYFHAQLVKTFHVYTRLHVRAAKCPGLNESYSARGTKPPYPLPYCKVRWAHRIHALHLMFEHLQFRDARSEKRNYLNISAYNKCLLDTRGTSTSNGLQYT